MPVRLDDPRPPYLQVADDLRRAIISGDLLPGQRLPSTRELATTYDIAPMTAQNAVRVLRDEGLVITHQGRGAFVRQGAMSRLDSAQLPPTSDVDRLRDAGISDLWPRTNEDAGADLLERIRSASQHITMFGLTRNFYARDNVLPLFEARATAIPVTFFAMDPYCDSRRDRYRLEPVEAALENPGRYVREVLRPLHAASQRIAPAAAERAGLRIFLYNFPCSFAIEQIDEVCRVMLYGHGKRGTDSPIFVFESGTPYYDYFRSQVEWIRLLASDPPQPWSEKGLVVRPLQPDDLIER